MASVFGIGNSIGSATVSGVSKAKARIPGTSIGVATVSGIGSHLVKATGSSTGVATVLGSGTHYVRGIGTALGIATVTGIGSILLPPNGAVTAAFELNGVVYGMVGSAQYPNFDVPFAFNINTRSFYPVAGVTPGNIPVSPATTGDWTPPTMDIVSTLLVVTHPGFRGADGNFFGWFDLTYPFSPVWHAGNVTPTAENTTNTVLLAPPTCCAQFKDRMYFAVGNALIPTDAGTLNLSNPGNVLLLGNATPITTMIGMPLSTTSISIFQGLICFKNNGIFQVTGDPITQDWAENEMSTSIGTDSPRSVQQTLQGIQFKSVDGIRLVNFLGQIQEPDPDLATPFINALYPSRVSAAYNANVYRICLQNGSVQGAPHQEYWLDIKRGGWTGPHTFQQDLAIPYKGTFIVASNAYPHRLFQSDALQTGFDRFIEEGVAMMFDYQTTPMTELNNLYANSALKSTLEIAIPANGATYQIYGEDESLAVLASGQLVAPTDQAIWNAFEWGDGTLWGAALSSFRPRIIPWTEPLVFNRLIEEVSGPCSQNLKLGSFFTAYERLNYMLP